VIKPAYSFSFLLSIHIFDWHNVLYFPNDLRMMMIIIIIIIIITAIELSLGGSSPYTSTDKTNKNKYI
jgi:hypothetical protein